MDVGMVTVCMHGSRRGVCECVGGPRRLFINQGGDWITLRTTHLLVYALLCTRLLRIRRSGCWTTPATNDDQKNALPVFRGRANRMACLTGVHVVVVRGWVWFFVAVGCGDGWFLVLWKLKHRLVSDRRSGNARLAN